MWQDAATVSAAALLEYELHLAAATGRRGHAAKAPPSPSPSALAAPDPAPDDVEFFDTTEPAVQPHADEVNLCAALRNVALCHYAATASSWLPPFPAAVFARSASGQRRVSDANARVHPCLLEEHELRYVFYHNACALGRYARHPNRLGRTPAPRAMASLAYVLDNFHQQNHTACPDECHAMFLPEVRPDKHRALDGIKSQTAEQFFAGADAFVAGASAMAPALFRTFVHWYNLHMCSTSCHRARRAPARHRSSHSRRGRGDPVAAPFPLSGDAAAAVTAAPGPAWASQRISGASALHSCHDSAAVHTLRSTLIEEMTFLRSDHLGCLERHGTKYELCAFAHAMRAAGCLSR